MAAPPGPGTNLRTWLLEQWCQLLALSLETMTGEVPDITPGNQPATIPAVKGWNQPLNLTAESRIWIGCPDSAWKAVGYRVLASAGLDEQTPEDQWGSYLEIIRQALSGVAQAIQGIVKREVLCEGGDEITPQPAVPAMTCTLRFGTEEPMTLYVVFDEDILRALDAIRQPQTAPPAAPASPQAVPTAMKPGTAQPIELLYDVQLPVSISFGRAHIPLKEVVKLTSGSIVELNRAISEPVEVIVNNCVIARGEVVVIDGNYGIRINQIITQAERLRTLH